MTHLRRRERFGRSAAALTALVVLAVVTACSSAGSATKATTTPGAVTTVTTAGPTTTALPSTARARTTSPRPVKTSRASSSRPLSPSASRATTTRPTAKPTSKPMTSPATVRVPAGTGPVVVLDPGHSTTIHATDPATGLNVSDYENEPEMQDVFAVAELVRARLAAVGYRVVMTKNSVDQPTSLGQRAAVANDAHAALAVSIHDQAGASGGIGFTQGNNTVYYQSVGTYRETAAGTKVYFTDGQVAATSARYGQIFRDEREHVEHVPVSLLSNTGYDLGSRSLPGGDIWMVQLLSRVPWIYNEAGGNSAGRIGLDSADQNTYADAIVAGVERCLPL